MIQISLHMKAHDSMTPYPISFLLTFKEKIYNSAVWFSLCPFHLDKSSQYVPHNIQAVMEYTKIITIPKLLFIGTSWRILYEMETPRILHIL